MSVALAMVGLWLMLFGSDAVDEALRIQVAWRRWSYARAYTRAHARGRQ